jgi:hypothetical protein
VNTPPTADSATGMLPNSPSQTFTFKYSSVNGYGYLSSVYALINSGLRASAGCYVYYLRGSNSLVLVNDTGTGIAGVLTPGAAGTLSNSQCAIDGPTSSVVGSGNTLSLTLGLTFKTAFVGTQTLYALAFDNGNLNSSWKTLGTWTSGSTVAIPPTTDSMTPNAGSGPSQHFTFKYSSVNGYRYLNAMYALINGSLSGAGGCWTYFLMGSNQLALVNDAGNGVAGVLTPGSAGTMSNSQCSIDGPTSSAVGSGNTLALTLAVTFKASFSGTQTFYGLAVDDANLYNGWKTLGTWTSH